MSEQKPLRIVRADSCVEIHVEGYQGVGVSPEIMKFNYFSTRQDPVSGEQQNEVVLILNMGLSSFLGIVKAHQELVETMVKDGIIPAERVKAS